MPWLNTSQKGSLCALGERLQNNNGCVIADEVGMGKTRVAVALAKFVTECGGRVCIAIPPGLGAQWKAEFRFVERMTVPEVVRSLHGFYEGFDPNFKSGWYKEPIVLVSHLFTNWQVRGNAAPERWALLPLIYRQWYKDQYGKYPRGSANLPAHFSHDYLWLSNMAATFYAYAKSEKIGQLRLKELFKDVPTWRHLYESDYQVGSELRDNLETVIGFGLGLFDLIIIDEAHKARGSSSNLERLLSSVLFRSSDCRCLAMTATPVELCIDEWEGTLRRISVPLETCKEIIGVARDYAASLRDLRYCWRTDATARDTFAKKAETFENALSPYVIRRDKREDEAVKKFMKESGKNFYEYRKVVDAPVEAAGLSPAWKQAVCAAEALSVVAENDNMLLKRMRLTMGNAHGITALLDTTQHHETLDAARDAENESGTCDAPEAHVSLATPEKQKRAERIVWWKKSLLAPFNRESGQGSALFEHPAIMRAVDVIESITGQNEKVLVFGKFTRPLQGLVALLNAREMLRRLQDKRPWPQESLGRDQSLDSSNAGDSGLLWAAIHFARKSLGLDMPLTDLQGSLKKQYTMQSGKRDRFRKKLIRNLEEELGQAGRESIFVALEKLRQAEQDAASESKDFLHVSNAIMEITGFDKELGTISPQQCAEAFVQLLNAFTERSYDDSEDSSPASLNWNSLCDYLREEYSAPRATFARLMYGQTKLPSRRIIQAAFNRAKAWPMVLVAQSVVGREGLNLHESCRHVVMLHPEWNPGVVEQQIGRVDRLNSLWSSYVKQKIYDKPITAHAIIFNGTYDEHHWKVLSERWKDLRGQLHGEVIPASDIRDADKDEYGDILKQIHNKAPKFSPKA
jgi:hypothetical protein